MKAHRPQAPGIRADGEANRALRRAYAKGEKWAVEAVQHQAGQMGRAAAAVAAMFADLAADSTEEAA